VDGEKYERDLPLFAGQGLLDDKAPAAQSVVPESLLAELPDRLRRAADEAISLYRFFEKKPGVNFAPVFTALLGAVDECAKGLVVQKLSPHIPSNQVDQQDWFSPYLGKVDQRMRRHYEELGRNLRKTLVYRSGVSPLGMLRSCLDYALNDSTKIEGIFDSMKTGLRFTGARDLLDRVCRMNDFRNSYVAHQEKPLTDPQKTKKAVSEWIEAIDNLWKAQNSASRP
jgi:type III restriction enzyme